MLVLAPAVSQPPRQLTVPPTAPTTAGDVVAVELLPEAQWRAPNAKLPTAVGKAPAGEGGEAGGEGEGEEEEHQEVPEVFQVCGGGTCRALGKETR